MIIESVVLAAGFSSRCNTNKMMLQMKDKTVIERCIDAFYPTCSKIIVVTGFYHEDISKVLKNYGKVEIIFNQNYEDGMFSSVRKGISSVKGDRIFLTPGDYPFIKHDTIEKLLSIDADLVKPEYNGSLGHPILLNKNLISRILTWPDTNLRDCLLGINYIAKEVNDKGIMMDIDTMEDYINQVKEDHD